MREIQDVDTNYPGFLLPMVVNPPDSLCFLVKVPNDQGHIAAFLGALYDLTLWNSWQRDSAKTGKQAAQIWKEIWVALAQQSCNPASASIGTDGGEDFMIRQNPTNPCILESSVDGITWCQWADLSKCLPSGSQPGSGAPQPGPGACHDFNTDLPGNSSFLVPVPVNTGDTIEILSANGAVFDGQGTAGWACPNGDVFFGGLCTFPIATQPADPLAGTNHGQLIIEIAGTFYPLTVGTPFTVPGGIVGQQPTIQANIRLSTGQGSFQFTVRVCNNQPAPWTSTLDFTVQNFSSFVTIVDGTYVAASGFHSVFFDAGDVAYVEIHIAMGVAATITQIQVFYNSTANGAGGNNEAEVIANVGGRFGSLQQVFIGSNIFTAVDNRSITTFNPSLDSGTASATIILSKIIISGTGVKPSILP